MLSSASILIKPIAYTFESMVTNFTTLSLSFQYGCVVLSGFIIGKFLNIVAHLASIMLELECHPEFSSLTDPTTDIEISSTTKLTNTPISTLNKAAKQTPTSSSNTLRENIHSLSKPRFHCLSCRHNLTLFENLLSILGHLLHRDRCATCHTSISLHYPAFELLSAGLAGAVLWRFGASLQALTAFGFIATLLTLALIDIDTRLLPDILTLPLIWAGLLVNLNASFTPLHSAVIGAATGYLSLWLINWGVYFLCGKDGIGYGDFKLFAALGAWLGWMALPQILFVASAIGTLFILVAITSSHLKKAQLLPFGPFLAMAGILILFSGTQKSEFF